MKFYKLLIAGLLILSVIKPDFTFSQDENKEEEEQQPPVIVMTTAHANFDYDEGSYKDWLAMEKEYFDKVTSKNEYLWGTGVLLHMFTEDNSEVVFIRVCKDWASIEKASDRDNELAKEAWPDKEERNAFFKKQSKYYTNFHSDEIYQALKGAKFVDEELQDEPHVYYIQKSQFDFPEDGTTEEIVSLYNEYNENVTQKNEYILGYYPHNHLYGSDSRDFVEVFVVNSFADIEKVLDKNNELAKAHWPDEEKRKEFFKNYGKYFTGIHGDYIYQNVPELSK